MYASQLHTRKVAIKYNTPGLDWSEASPGKLYFMATCKGHFRVDPPKETHRDSLNPLVYLIVTSKNLNLI